MALTIVLVFGLKLVLNMTFNLDQPIFQKKFLFEDIWPRSSQNLVVFLQFTGPVNVFLLHLRSLLWSVLLKPCRRVLTVRDFSWLSILDVLLSNFSNNFVKRLFGVDDSLSLWCSEAETVKTPPLFFLLLTAKFSSLSPSCSSPSHRISYFHARLNFT